MTSSSPHLPQGHERHPTGLRALTLWSGGVATAIVVSLIALVGVLVFRGVFDVPVLAPEGEGTWGDASTTYLMLVAALAALFATALVHVLLLSTPRALSFFGWIIGLATVAAVAAPFTTDADTDSKVATAIISAVIGLAIVSLISSVATMATGGAARSSPG